MPNHCETDLTLKGSPELIKLVLATHFTEDGELNCDSVIPYPANFKELDRVAKEWDDKPEPKDYRDRPTDGFNSGGYEWCVNNWGTKWGTYDGRGVELNLKGTIAKVSFNSAWSPPTNTLNKLAEMYPGLTIVAKSYERGMAFKCDYRWEGGQNIQANESSYHGNRGG